MSAGGHGGGGLPLLGWVHETMHGLHSGYGVVLPGWTNYVPFILFNIAFLVVDPVQTARNWSMLLLLSPIWLPVILTKLAAARWMVVKRFANNANQEHVLLEIRVPRDTRKTPVAMETVFRNINIGPGEGTWWKKNILGRTRPWFSFELVSIEGRVHFCVWTRVGFRRAIETYIYAQYPGVEIVEIPDFMRMVDPYAPNTRIWSCQYKLKLPDPFPLSTYVDYNLDKPDKPEEQTDPLSQVIEFLGSLGKGERLWLQIIIRNTKHEKYGGKLNKKGKKYTMSDEGQEIIEALRKETMGEVEFVDSEGKLRKQKTFPNPTKGQMENIAAIERNIDKGAFDVGMRALYIADQDKALPNIGAYVSQIWRPFAGWNEITPDPNVGSEMFTEFPWEDRGGHHYQHEMHKMVEAARRRSYFHYPYVGNNMILNTAVLATLFHIPSATVTAPGLPRISSSSREAPPDLPI